MPLLVLTSLFIFIMTIHTTIGLAGFDPSPPRPRSITYNKHYMSTLSKNYKSIRSTSSTPGDIPAIRAVIKDVYVHHASSPSTFWFVGKIAHCCPAPQAVQLIRKGILVEHARRLRPEELDSLAKGSTSTSTSTSTGLGLDDFETWIAPGDSEMDVAYNRPDVVFTKVVEAVAGDGDGDGEEPVDISNVGFEAEIYTNGESGFRTERNVESGGPLKPEIINTPKADDLSDKEVKVVLDDK